MTQEEMLAQILLELERVKRDLSMIKMSVSRDVDEDGVPEGHDVQLIDGYAISMTKREGSNGKKNPVMFLYNSRMPLKTLAVYGSQSHLLPAFMRLKVDWEKGEYQRIVETERQDVIDAGMYHECPAFKVLRKHGEILENVGHAKKDLAGVVWLSDEAQRLEDEISRKSTVAATPSAQAKPAQAPKPQAAIVQQSKDTGKPLRFASGDDAIKWATSVEIKAANEDVGVKKFDSEKDAKLHYDTMKSEWKPSSAAEMFNRWAAHIQTEVSIKWAVAKKYFPDEIECRKALSGDYADDVDAKTKISALLREHIAKKKVA